MTMSFHTVTNMTEFADDVTENMNSTFQNISDGVLRWSEGYPIIYPITVYHMYPVVMFGRIVNIIWYVIGFTGNIVSLKIWTLSRMKRTNSSALYLIAITICDIAYQVLHVFFYLKYFWGLAALSLTVFCQVWNVLNIIPQYASQVLVLGFTAERFVSIIKPFQGERFSKTHRAPKIVAAIFFLVVVAAIPQAFFWEVDHGFCEMRSREDIVYIYTIWSFISESAIFFLIPVVTLILNIFLLREARRSMNRHKTLDVEANGSSRIHRKTRKCGHPIKTLLCISFFRILTQLPVSVTYSIQNLDAFGFGNTNMSLAQMSQNRRWQSFFSYWRARMCIETLGASHHALSVFVFYASTRQFRVEIGKMLASFKKVVFRKQSDTCKLENMNELKYTSSVYTRTSATLKEVGTRNIC